MLVLSRKRSERIVIGENVVITLVASRDGRARIGIEAPTDVSIHRGEVYDRIVKERRAEGDAEGTPG